MRPAMQPPPTGPPAGAWEFLAELLDAKWFVTTLIATYAAVVSTFQAFIKEWWVHRPRIKLMFYQAKQVGGGVAAVETLALNVINNGYQARKIHSSISFEIKELMSKRKGAVALVTTPQFVKQPPEILPSSDSFIMFFPQHLAVDDAREGGLRGSFHVRAFIQDGTNKRFNSKWLKLEAGD